MILFTLLNTVLRSSSKFSLRSKNIPRCFCNATCWTGLLLKIKVGWKYILSLFERVRVEVYFPLIGPVTYFFALYNWAKKFFFALYKRETSANNLVLEDKSSDKSLIYTKRSSGPRIDPWGTSSRTLVQDDV